MKLACFLLPLVLPVALAANDAAMNDGSEGPVPLGWLSGEESIIQMKEEHLDIHFGVPETKVLARFTFLSHKTSGPAKQKLGFPNLSRSHTYGDISGPIEGLITRVNGKEVPSILIEGYFKLITKEDGSSTFEQSPVEAEGFTKRAWYTIDVTFPPGEEVVVEREYRCPSGGSTNFDSFFVYETRTGGAWKDKIERLTAKVTFDDSVRKDLVLFNPKTGWQWAEDRSSATLEWDAFEPRTEEDRQWISITTLNMPLIQRLHKEHPDLVPSVEAYAKKWMNKMQKLNSD